MTNRWFHRSLTVICLSFASPVLAYEDNVLLIPKSISAIASLAQITAHPLVTQSRRLLSKTESDFLVSQGDRATAESIIATVRDEQSFKDLKKWGERHTPGISIERNGAIRLNASESEEVGALKWALNNDPKNPIRVGVAYDDTKTLVLERKSFEDLGLTRLASSPRARPTRAVKVAFLDTGIDFSHPALREHLYSNDLECEALKKYVESLEQIKKDKVACLAASQEDLQNCILENKIPRSACNAKNAAALLACQTKNDEQKKQAELLANQDRDRNGYAMDCHGWSVVSPMNATSDILGNYDAADTLGHGTHIAGLILDVAPQAQLMPIQIMRFQPNGPVRPQDLAEIAKRDLIFNPSEPPPPIETDLQKLGATTAFVDMVGRGMLYALINGAEVVNVSLSWPPAYDSMFTQKIFNLAMQTTGKRIGAVVVASAGNDSSELNTLPCAYEGVVCVASHGPDGAISHFSNYGAASDLAAPGFSILSTYPTQLRSRIYTARTGYELKSGTSMSSPLVAGMAARMLGDGISKSEIYPRLLLGTRPHSDSTLLGPTLPKKFTRSGNAMLAGYVDPQSGQTIPGAYDVLPQPLILADSKTTLKLSWDLRAKSLPIQWRLKNYWTQASSVRIHASVLNAPGIELTESDWTVESWNSNTPREFNSEISIRDKRIAGRFSIQLTVTSAGVDGRKFQIPVEIGIPLDPDQLPDTKIESLPIVGEVMPETESLRSVSGLNPEDTADYLAIYRGPEFWKLQLLRNQGTFYQAQTPVQIAAPAGVKDNLMPIRKFDWDQTGKESYVLILGVIKNQSRILRFVIFDDQLKLKTQFEYSNTDSVLNERFQWMNPGNNQAWTPAWVAAGKMPASEKPKFDPWDPNPRDYPEFRFYYLSGGETRTVNPPEGYTFFQILTPTTEQRRRGEVPVLLGKARNYVIPYATGIVRNLKLEEIKPLELARYRNLVTVSAQNSLDILSLDTSHTTYGTAFNSFAYKGAQQSTLIPHSGVSSWLDPVLEPVTPVDSVVGISGVFADAKRTSVFAQTHYELQFHDLSQNKVATTSFNRYTFLPRFISEKTVFPAIVMDPGGKKLPGLYVPGGLGDTSSIEVVVPFESPDGLTLVRPARLRFQTSEACPVTVNPIAATKEFPTQVVFFCRDRFLRIPLEF